MSNFPMSGTRDDMEQWIRDRANRDPQFRERLVRDPRGTAAEIIGKPVPAAQELIVIDPAPGKVYVVHRIDGTPVSTAGQDVGHALAAHVHHASYARDSIWSEMAGNAKGVLQSLGARVPPDANIEVLTETPTRLYLVLDAPHAKQSSLASWSLPSLT